MRMGPKFDSPDEKRRGKLDKSLVDKFNLSGNIKKTVSRVTMKEECDFFSEYLINYIDTCQYIMAQNRGADPRSGTKKLQTLKENSAQEEKLKKKDPAQNY